MEKDTNTGCDVTLLNEESVRKKEWNSLALREIEIRENTEGGGPTPSSDGTFPVSS
jgi:hypothetical protein